jgi:hypothetical protein
LDLAAFITLIGIIFSQIVSIGVQVFLYYQFVARLKHEELISRLNSKSSMQRDIYIEAAQEIAYAIQILNQIPYIEKSHIRDIDEKVKLGPISNKVHMIGSIGVIERLSTFNKVYTECLLKTLGEVTEAHINDMRAESASAEIDRILNEQSANINSQNEQSLKNQKHLELRNEFDKKMAERKAAWDNSKFFKDKAQGIINQYSPSINDCLTLANLEIRRELHFSFDENAYLEIAKGNNAFVTQISDSFRHRLSQIK